MTTPGSSAAVDTEVTAAVGGARKVLAAFTVAQYLDERTSLQEQDAQHKLPPHKSAVCVDPGDTLGEILDTLARNNFLAAPVVEKASCRYSGFVDVAGILSIFGGGCPSESS
jgi:hypothetical protein